MSVTINFAAVAPTNSVDRGGAYTPVLTASIQNTTAAGMWWITGNILHGMIHVITTGNATVSGGLTATIPTAFTMNTALIPTGTTAGTKTSVLGWGTWFVPGTGDRDIWAKYDSAGKLRFYYLDQQLDASQMSVTGHAVDIVFAIPINER